MEKDIWINLPVKDIARSKSFFTEIGFSFHPLHRTSSDAAALIIGEKGVTVMLYEYKEFEMVTGMKKLEQDCQCEVLFSITVDSRNAVDEIAHKVNENGGHVFAEPQEKGGWVYGCGFADPDGHRWNVLCTNMKKEQNKHSELYANI